MAVTETPPETVAAAAAEVPSVRPAPTGLAAVLGTGDHKVIGRLYIVSALILGLGVVVLGELFAVEGMKADTLDVFSGGSVFQFFTLFRVGSLFLLAFPLVIGLAMVVVPLQVGARSIAFPRAAAASYWAWLMGAGLLIASYALDGGPAGTRASGVDLWITAMGVLVLAVLAAAVSLATTVFALRTPGLSITRAPLYAWSVAVAAVMWLLTLPVLFGVLVIAYVDHRHGGQALGASDNLFGHLSWLLRNPEVYVVAIPVLGFAADVIATTAQARIAMRGVVHTAIGLAGAAGFGAYLLAADERSYHTPVYILQALVAVVPVLAVLALAGDLFRRGSLRVNAGLIYATCALLTLLVGVGAGALGSIPALKTTGTIFDIGVDHAVLLAAVIASLGGLHWWATKVGGGQAANENLGRLAPVVLLVGALVASVPDMVSGIAGKEQELRPDWTGGIEGLNAVTAVGVAILALGLVLAVVSLLPLLRRADQGERDPWTGQTLEWLAPSPPPLENFDAELPVVTSAEPLVDLREEK